jgi:hypothetical protein
VTTNRCPACAASVPEGAPWCTLCYADLRPVSAPTAEVAAPAAPVDVLGELFPVSAPAVLLADPVTEREPQAQLLPHREPQWQPQPQPQPQPHEQLAEAPQQESGTTWPCLACGEQMPLEATLCGHCGASFLPTATMPTLKLPGLGVISNLEGGAKAMVIVGGAVVITILFFVAALVLGSFV